MKKLTNKFTFLSLLIVILLNSCHRSDMLSLQNGKLKVDFYSGMPVFKNIIYLKDTLRPNIGKGLAVNGEVKEWKQWVIKSTMKGDTVVYTMKLQQPEITTDFVYWLDSCSIRMKIRNVEDKNNVLQEIGFEEQPWVSVSDTSYRWWTVKNWTREPFGPKKVFSRGIGMYNAISGNARDTVQKKGLPNFACIWNAKKFCIALKTNMEVYPIRIWSDSAGCNLAPNKYYYRVKDTRLPDFEAQLTFIPDLNQNNISDKGDYFVWCNRQLKGPDQLHKNTFFGPKGSLVQFFTVHHR